MKRRVRIARTCQPDRVPRTGILKKMDLENLYGCSYQTISTRYAAYIPLPLNKQPSHEGCFTKNSPLVWNAADVWAGL